jgi:hypothetical protein
MDLQDYPRPQNDTGIGVHWSAGYPAAVGLGQIRDMWLPELDASGVKWVKIARADGGTALDELLLNHGIMPIVRVYRPQPNPGTLDQAALALVREHVAAGVRYFEFNNEPDLGGEWQHNYLPPNALAITAANAIVDMEAILALGGYPGIPAVTVGCKWDLVGEICRQGRRDLLREGVWQAVHNYALNHPLDYPGDPGNRQGEPYTAAFYNRFTTERWDGDAWGGWSLERINAARATQPHPTDTPFDDPSGWRAFERHDTLIRNQIGRSLPILATEGGYIVGERQDVRYPATTPLLHMAQTLEACRTLMATSTRFERAPDWFFCSAFWLLGNYTLGHWAAEWEGATWYSSRWPGGRLPAVDALKGEPKKPRVWHGDGGVAVQVTGTVVTAGADRGRLTVMLTRQPGGLLGDWADHAHTDDAGGFGFIDVPPGAYTLTVAQVSGFRQDIALNVARPPVVVTLDLTSYTVVREESGLRGTVVNGAGLTVRLVRQDGAAQEQRVTAESAYAFSGLAAGTYTLTLVDTAVSQTNIVLDGENVAVVDLKAPGWGWAVSVGGVSPGFGVVLCRVKDRPGVSVHLWANGWAGLTQLTGSKTEYGPDVCEFAPLGAGAYCVQIAKGVLDGAAAPQATLTLDGSRIVWLTFSQAAEQPPHESVIAGHVSGGAGRTVTLTGPADAATMHASVGSDGSYRFERLGPGLYRLLVEGTTLAHDGITLDGTNQATVDLTLPADHPTGGWTWTAEDAGMGPGFSIVRCRVTDKPGTSVHLWMAGWADATRLAGSKAEYGADACEFAPLSPGKYEIEPAGLGVRAQVQLAQNRLVWVTFAAGAVSPAVQADSGVTAGISGGTPQPAKEVAPEKPTQSRVYGRVRGGAGQTILLAGPEDANPPIQRTTTAGMDELYSFDNLPAGVYKATAIAANQVQAGIALDGTNAAEVDFDLGTLEPNKTIEHYLWVGSNPRTHEDFLTVLRYVRQFQPAIGQDETEARQARHVTILGNTSAVSALSEQGLRMSGCLVQRIESNVGKALGQLLADNKPY